MQKRAFIVEKVLPQRANLLRMITNFLPELLADLQRTLPEMLPKKTTQEYLASLWYDLHRIMQALTGVCSGGGGGFTRGDKAFVEDVLDGMMVVLNGAVSFAVTELQQEKMDAARKAIVKLPDVERRR